jgi:cation:H+ antiporter
VLGTALFVARRDDLRHLLHLSANVARTAVGRAPVELERAD